MKNSTVHALQALQCGPKHINVSVIPDLAFTVPIPRTFAPESVFDSPYSVFRRKP